MSRRWGFGPVFAYEWLTNARRPQFYLGRALFVVVLLLGLTCVWGSRVASRPSLTMNQLANVGRAFFIAIVSTQLTLVLFAAPTATAGAICQEKARGNLAQLLMTDLSDAEIVLGKLAARLVPVIGLVACALPVMAIGSLLGGIDPVALTIAFAITLSVAILGCSIAFTLSIWGTKPHEVLLATFAIYAVWLLTSPVWEFLAAVRGIPPLPRWALDANPYFLAFEPYVHRSTVEFWDYLAFIVSTLGISAVLVLLSIGRLRRVVIGQADRADVQRSPRGWLRRDAATGPSLDQNPTRWYEWHRKRPSPWIRTLIAGYFGFAIAFTALAIETIFTQQIYVRNYVAGYVTAFQSAIGIPLLLVWAAMALVEERARGSLDILLTTPLSSREVVLTKWWSAFRLTPRVITLPMLVIVVLAWDAGRLRYSALILAYLLSSCALWTSVGLLLSTWIKRVSRATALAVFLFTVASLGWPLMSLTILSRFPSLSFGLSLISPFYGAFYLTAWMHEGSVPWFLMYGTAWAIAQTVLAALLLIVVLATFDRRIGRMSERARPERQALPPSPAVTRATTSPSRG